jgi:alanyl-tRNA synthetase
VLRYGKKENFWEMGESGPCGPCSEIHIDLRLASEKAKTPAKELVNGDHPEVIEIWNLVFMEFNRKADRSLEPLANKHVDTGMGLERLSMILQGHTSNYDSDIFTPLIDHLAKKSKYDYGKSKDVDIAFRVISDHVRALAFSIADGQLPSNVKAGYVLRRILRRAIRYAYSFLEFREPVIYSLVPILAQQFEEVFPEIQAQKALIENVIREEEKAFLKTLNKGLLCLKNIEKNLKSSDQNLISGKEAFELYDTYGFPIDLTLLIAQERKLDVNVLEFEQYMLQQKNRSRAAADQKISDWVEVHGSLVNLFVGYDEIETNALVNKYRVVKKGEKETVQILLDRTPFYAESGGQVGDSGKLIFGDEIINVLDCKKEQNLHLHICNKMPKDIGLEVCAKVDTVRRQKIKSNHSATHLLQGALKEVLGAHVEQKGSFLNDSYLRFDFTHFQKMSDQELIDVEKIVNLRIQAALEVNEIRELPKDEAMALGAMALFGEKYGDLVRVITMDPEFSVELCGGTHVVNTSEISLFKITSESAVASGIRRVEALTGSAALKMMNQKESILEEIKLLLNNPKQLKLSIEQLIKENNKLKKELEVFQLRDTRDLKKDIEKNLKDHNGILLNIKKLKSFNQDLIKTMVFELRSKYDNLCLIIANTNADKVTLTIVLSDYLVKEKGLNAAHIIRACSKAIQGGGGGQPFYATAGGKNAEGLDEAIAIIKDNVFKG